MKNKILYIALAIIFLVAIYFVTVTQVLISNQNEFNENIYKTARETKDFDEFLAVQVKQYLKLDEISNDDYKMALYQITDNEDDQKIVIILVPLRTVNFASSAEDINDKSQIIVKNLTSDDEIFNTNSFNTAISYGYDKSKVGFMFFSFTLNENSNLNIKYYDYNNNLVFDYKNYFNLRSEEELELTFEQGYSIEEIKIKMDYDKELRNKLMLRIGIYIGLIILIPYLYNLTKVLILKYSKGGKKSK